MGISVLAAKILALVYISVDVGILSGKLKYDKLIEDFETSSGLTYLAGIFTLIIGVLLVEYHNIWVKNWTVLITIIGWVALIKGVMLVAFPQFISYFKNWYKNTRAWSIFIIALGLLFGYFGFLS